ncbi:MAG: hypothetical protein V4584_15115 [Verrucomicrobiota bacterium]
MPSSLHLKLPLGVAICAVSLFSAGCGKKEDPSVWWQGEQERTTLSQQLELKNFRYDQASTKSFDELKKVRTALNESNGRLESLRARRELALDQLDSLRSQWAGLREATVRTQRQQAMGRTFEKLALPSGRQFEKVSVSAITDSGVTIRHTDGMARLRYADLDPEQRVFFGLDGDLAAAAHEKEALDAVAYENWIDSQMAANRMSEEKTSQASQREEIAARQKRSDSVAQQIASANSRALAQPAKSVGSGSYSNYRYRTYRSSYYSPVYYSYRNPCYYNYCSPRLNVYPKFPAQPRTMNTRYYSPSPTTVPRSRSIADTTIRSIP